MFDAVNIKFINKYFKFVTQEELKDEYILIDLRKRIDFETSHLKNSIHLKLLTDKNAIKLEELHGSKKYFLASIMSIIYMFPNLYRVNKKIKEYEKEGQVVLLCRHAKIRSRFIAAFVNLLGSNVMVLKDGVNRIVGME